VQNRDTYFRNEDQIVETMRRNKKQALMSDIPLSYCQRASGNFEVRDFPDDRGILCADSWFTSPELKNTFDSFS
jgi:hypothetical protein